MATIQIVWGGKGWAIVACVPRITIDTMLNRFNHFQVDFIPYLSHIDWFIITATEIVHVPQRVATCAN